jgi:hypothetical protein
MGRSAEGEALLREREDLVKARAESQKDAEALRVLVEEGMCVPKTLSELMT